MYSNLPTAFVPNSVFSLQMSLKNCRRKTISINFDVLNLTQTERDAVYEAVINLVESCLKKSRKCIRAHGQMKFKEPERLELKKSIFELKGAAILTRNNLHCGIYSMIMIKLCNV